MTNVLRWLFGVAKAPSETAGGSWRLAFNALPEGSWAAAMVLAACVAVGGVWWLYRREGRELSNPLRALLAAIRLAILSVVVLMLLELVLVRTTTELVPARLLVLTDTSQSMSLADPYTDSAAAAEIAKRLGVLNDRKEPDVEQLRKRSRLELAKTVLAMLTPELSRGRLMSYYQFAGQINALPDVAAVGKLEAKGETTALGDALATALAQHRGQPLAGIVVVSDGRSNVGEEPLKVARQAAGEAVPIYALAAGTSQGPRNIRLAELEASPVVFVRDTAEINVHVESRGLVGQPVTITLERRAADGAWTEIGSDEVTLGEDGVLSRVPFRFTPDATGQFEFRARASDVGPELTDADNLATANVKVIRQKIRVLLVAGSPSSEYQFLRNTLMRDEAVEFASWLQTAEGDYEQMGHRPIRRLPANQAELDHYDVLLLLDPDMPAMGSSWPELIGKFVGEAGGGLIYVAGELHSRQLFMPGMASDRGAAAVAQDNSWIKTLPVVCDQGLYQSSAEARLSARETWRLELTSAGGADSIFQFDAEQSKNREVLASLPGMFWHFPVTRAKPGATVLARHGDPRMQNSFGRHVLMATQLYGPGRTVFVGFDSTYRWRYLHEEYFDGFWARLIDRVGRSKVLGGRYPFTLSTDKNAYRVGDRITLRAQFLDAADVASSVTELSGELEIGDRPPQAVSLVPLAHDATTFEATLAAADAGNYTLRVMPAAPVEGETAPRAATLNFRVEPPRQELDNPTWNRALLDDLALAGDGRTFSLDEAVQLPPAIKIHQVERVFESRDEIWDAPVFFSLIVLLLTTEWVLRKMYRMA